MDYRVSSATLPRRPMAPGVQAGLLHGRDNGLESVSLMFGEVAPGAHVPLHRHAYEEVFVITAGQGEWTIGNTTLAAGVGDIVSVPTGVPHTFRNTGDVPLCQTAVHATAHISIEWLDGR